MYAYHPATNTSVPMQLLTDEELREVQAVTTADGIPAYHDGCGRIWPLPASGWETRE